MSKTDFSEVKVGDRVWEFTYCWGTIIKITPSTEYSITVKFDNITSYHHFTKEGREHPQYNPSLFWDEIKFEIPERPKRKIKKEGWVNIYLDARDFTIRTGVNIYSSQTCALDCQYSKYGIYIATTKIEWEEYE